ncbi:MAG: Mov34/MPN/PAD-1 family protein [Promethearchaeota archaeon]
MFKKQDDIEEEKGRAQKIKNIEKNIGVKLTSNEKDEKKSFSELLKEYEDSLTEGNQKGIDTVHTPVYVSWKAYKRIVGYSLRYSGEFIDSNEWREVYGLLIGHIEDKKRLIVSDAIPMTVGDATGVEFEYIHYADYAEIDGNVYQRAIEDGKSEFTVGWFHSHPGLGHFFSPTDTATQLYYQSLNPFAVAIEFDHQEKKEDNLGLSALRLTCLEDGMDSPYDFVELRFFVDSDKEIHEKIEATINKMKDKMPEVLEAINYIDNQIIKLELPQLQKKFSLLLDPDGENDEEEFKYEEKSYIWDPESTKKLTKGAPKFRAKVEKEMEQCSVQLKGFLKKDDLKSYYQKKEQFKEKIKILLDKPNSLLHKVMDDYGKAYDIILPFRDFLDSKERKTLEHFEEWIYGYFRVFDNLKFALASL